MKRIGGMLLGVGAVFLLMVPPAQAAMRVIVARILGGQVEVVGFRAAKKAPISWQGTEVATSTAGGTFFFHNAAVPASCVGKLSDGVETAYIPVQGCVPTGVNLAVTGQTTPNEPGEDGAVQAGVPFPSPRFTDNGNGTVTDNLTGLIWLQNADCPADTRTWADALGDVTQLNTDGTMNGIGCGDTSNGGTHQTDWRLPNLRELQSLIDYEFSSPALSNATGTAQWTDGHAFSNVFSLDYWSSTTDADSSCSDCAWAVSFLNGLAFPSSKTASGALVLPVRGGP